jgi:hypoxanthine phosphoribosyltransferase
MTSTFGSSLGPRDVTLLFSAAEIADRIEALADAVATRPPVCEGPLLLIGLLRGAIPFVSDLSRALSARGAALEIDYITASSYVGTSAGDVRLGERRVLPFHGRDVLVVDDILDTGLTLEAVLAAFRADGPSRLETCVLLDKKSRRVNGLGAEFVGFSCPARFVVGYGMDLDGRFRELPFIGTVASL